MPLLFLSTENKEEVNMSHCFSIWLPGALPGGMFSKPRKSPINKKHRVSPPRTPASSSIISCVISTNIQPRRQLLDYIKLGGGKWTETNKRCIPLTRQNYSRAPFEITERSSESWGIKQAVMETLLGTERSKGAFYFREDQRDLILNSACRRKKIMFFFF